MPDRRTFLQRLASLPALSALLPEAAAAAPAGHDYFANSAVRTFINAAGTYTTLTASLMPPEVMEAMQYASRSYVPSSSCTTRRRRASRRSSASRPP